LKYERRKIKPVAGEATNSSDKSLIRTLPVNFEESRIKQPLAEVEIT
jgi:hypothetical protein